MPHTKENELADLLKGQSDLMQEVYSLLEKEEKQDELVRAAIRSSYKPAVNQLQGLEQRRIFSNEAIRRTCIKYRLRFLPAGRFKGPVPHQAIAAVRQLEQWAGRPVKGFMILAPAGRFKLCDCDADPILFVPLANGQFYMVHRWGRDMHPLRAVWGWPVRSLWHVVACAFTLALLLGALAPTTWLTPEPGAPWWGLYRFGAIFCACMLVGAACSFGWLAFFGQTSREAWNSNTFN